MATVVATMLAAQRFDETTRLKELLLASFSQLNDALLSAGNRLATGASATLLVTLACNSASLVWAAANS